MVRCKQWLMLIVSSVLIWNSIHPENETFLDDTMTHSVSYKKKKSASSKNSSFVEFKYDQVDLKDIINSFAQQREINIYYPETLQFNVKVSFDAGKKITGTEAWNFILMMLDQAGFSLVCKGDATYMITPNKGVSKENLPFYFNVNYNSLPDSYEKIRYFYYFTNIVLSSKQGTDLTGTILKNIFGESFVDQVDINTYLNGITFTASSIFIKSIMPLLLTLDERGFKESIEILPLKWANSAEVAKILTSMISSDQKNGYIGMTSGIHKSHYFSDFIVVQDLDPKNVFKINSVLIMGAEKHVQSVKDFITKYLDIAQDKGESFYHVIELQWLKASDFVQVLNNLVKESTSGTGQSTGAVATSELSFDPQIQIIPEKISTGSGEKPAAGGQIGGPDNTAQRGSNRLIIACMPKDWERIQALIKEVDIPQKQVIVEGLVMDLSVDFIRSLGSQIRTRGLCPSIFPRYMQAQAGLVINNIISPTGSAINDATLVGDLSDILNPDGVAGTGGTGSLCTPNVTSTLVTPNISGSAPNVFANSSVYMLDGGKSQTDGVWAFFQLLSTHKTAKILTRPVIIAVNNKEAALSSSITKQLADGSGAGVSPTISYSMDNAPISIIFTPLISENNTVNLQVSISLSSWVDPTVQSSGLKNTRSLNTNVFMKSGDILILGGLLQDTTTRARTSVPFLDMIPIIGNFFSTRNKETAKTQLFVLLRPTVVAPRTKGGMGNVTRKAANFMNHQFSEYEDAFANLRDPITHWFFGDNVETCHNRVNDKIADLIAIDNLKSVYERDMDSMIAQNDIENTPEALDAGWFSTETNAKNKEYQKDVSDLTERVEKILNPFSKKLVE